MGGKISKEKAVTRTEFATINEKIETKLKREKLFFFVSFLQKPDKYFDLKSKRPSEFWRL
jgi:hypothetical protein